MRIVGITAVMMALLAGPVWAQTQNVPQYGDTGKDKTRSDIEAEKEAERAYRRSLGNIPEQKSSDPWGTMRGDNPPKAAAKGSAAKGSDAKTAKPKAKSADTKPDSAAK
jgi:hypothetical protein